MSDPRLAGDRERIYLLFAYGLFLLAVVHPALTLIGFIMALVRERQVHDPFYESHYRNLLTVFYAVLALVLLMMVAALFGMMGWAMTGLWHPAMGLFFWWWPMPMMWPLMGLIWLGMGVWYLWRVVGGFIRALEEKPY